VSLTPTGYADAVHEGVFVTPAERQMTVSQFLDIVTNKTPVNGVVYIQKQNSNFTEEFSEVSDDVDLQLAWATRAFGNLTLAVSYLSRLQHLNFSRNFKAVVEKSGHCPKVWEFSEHKFVWENCLLLTSYLGVISESCNLLCCVIFWMLHLCHVIFITKLLPVVTLGQGQ